MYNVADILTNAHVIKYTLSRIIDYDFKVFRSSSDHPRDLTSGRYT